MQVRKRIRAVICAVLVIAAAVWAADKLPFTQEIDQTVDAAVYQNGALAESTSVYMKGEKTRYLFRPNSFVGTFRISCMAETNIEALQTQISWHKGEHLQSIGHFYRGAFLSASEHGLAYYLLISEDMRQFAMMTTDGRVIATSAAACQLYTDHISYDGDGHMTVYDAESIPELGS